MDLQDVVRKRRAYRSLSPVVITEELVRDLAGYAQLSPSCYNNQPWRFVFVYDPEVLEGLYDTLPRGNQWGRAASLIIAVFSTSTLDCVIREREYFLFDTGMATAFLMLRATEMGLVAHPIAGYDEEKAKELLGIPGDMRLITLLMVGKHSRDLSTELSEKQRESEGTRPERLPFGRFAYMNRYQPAREGEED